jgi:hypothetical protein
MRFVRALTPPVARWAFVACAVPAFAAVALSASCTLLVHFDDAAGGACDGGECADATQPLDAHADGDAGAAGDAASDAGGEGSAPDAADGGVDHYAPCGNLASGYYCATDGLHGYAGPANDLVHCVDGGIGQVTSCDGGCLPLPAPFPDACNPCVGHPDGLYCGRDLAGFPAINADFLIQCQTANVVQSVACAHGCKSSGTASSCYP